MMPEQKPGRSRQDYATPTDFMEAFAKRFGAPDWDLAASEENAKAQYFYTKEQDSLSRNWSWLGRTLWLNPPFEDITPWAMKCADTTAEPDGCIPHIFMLVPASIGSNWYRDWVQPNAYVLALNPRLSFDGIAPYPKDCMLCCYMNGLTGFRQWTWK